MQSVTNINDFLASKGMDVQIAAVYNEHADDDLPDCYAVYRTQRNHTDDLESSYFVYVKDEKRTFIRCILKESEILKFNKMCADDWETVFQLEKAINSVNLVIHSANIGKSAEEIMAIQLKQLKETFESRLIKNRTERGA